MWFSKNKEDKNNARTMPKFPELPDLPSRPALIQSADKSSPGPMQKESLPLLPSFPNSDTANKMSREAIKSALTPEPQQEWDAGNDMERFTPEKLKPYTQEIESEQAVNNLESFRVEDSSERKEVEEPVRRPAPVHHLNSASERLEPIFVRIDKFQAAIKNIHEIKKHVSEIEAYLSELKKIKAKEDEELGEWEHEIQNTKNKLDSIDKTLFSKLD